MNECDGIVSFMDTVVLKKTNTIETNIASTDSINRHSKKVRDYYILHIVLLAIILLSINIIIYY